MKTCEITSEAEFLSVANTRCSIDLGFLIYNEDAKIMMTVNDQGIQFTFYFLHKYYLSQYNHDYCNFTHF